jgi:hypothetical protein
VNEQPGANTLWVGNAIGFAVVWNRLHRRARVGALIGIGSTFVLYFITGFIGGYMGHRAH